MTLERFAFVSLLASLLMLFLTGCSGQTDSITEPTERTMEYVVEGRVYLGAAVGSGVAGVRIRAGQRTSTGHTETIAEVTSNASGDFTVRFEGLTCPESGRGYSVVAEWPGYEPDYYWLECGVPEQTWNPILVPEPECLWFCGPVDWG